MLVEDPERVVAEARVQLAELALGRRVRPALVHVLPACACATAASWRRLPSEKPATNIAVDARSRTKCSSSIPSSMGSDTPVRLRAVFCTASAPCRTAAIIIGALRSGTMIIAAIRDGRPDPADRDRRVLARPMGAIPWTQAGVVADDPALPRAGAKTPERRLEDRRSRNGLGLPVVWDRPHLHHVGDQLGQEASPLKGVFDPGDAQEASDRRTDIAGSCTTSISRPAPSAGASFTGAPPAAPARPSLGPGARPPTRVISRTALLPRRPSPTASASTIYFAASVWSPLWT